jgi:transcriptional regulator with XRE-family HTH domain
MKTKVHDRIKELRSALALSQTEFAYQTGISHSLLTKIEAGDNPPTNKVLAKIIDKWQVSQDWLISGKGEMAFEKSDTAKEPWKDEAWQLAKEQIAKKDEQLDRVLTFLSRFEVPFLQPVRETA